MQAEQNVDMEQNNGARACDHEDTGGKSGNTGVCHCALSYGLFQATLFDTTVCCSLRIIELQRRCMGRLDVKQRAVHGAPQGPL